MNKLTPNQIFGAAHPSYKVLWMDAYHRVYLADRERVEGEKKGFRKRVRIYLNVDMKPGDVFYRPEAIIVKDDPFDKEINVESVQKVDGKCGWNRFKVTTTQSPVDLISENKGKVVSNIRPFTDIAYPEED